MVHLLFDAICHGVFVIEYFLHLISIRLGWTEGFPGRSGDVDSKQLLMIHNCIIILAMHPKNIYSTYGLDQMHYISDKLHK